MAFIQATFSNFRRPGLWAAAVAALGLAAMAAPARERDGKHLDRMVERMEKELKLSKDQTAKIRAILAKNAPSMPQDDKTEGRDEAGPRHGFRGPHEGGPAFGPGMDRALIAQLRAGSVDTAALNRSFTARADSMRARMIAGHARRVAAFAEVHAVLTPEQRALAADKWEKRAAEMEKKSRKKHDAK